MTGQRCTVIINQLLDILKPQAFIPTSIIRFGWQFAETATKGLKFQTTKYLIMNTLSFKRRNEQARFIQALAPTLVRPQFNENNFALRQGMSK